MEYSGLGFVEAVKDLAGRIGMAVPELRGEAAQGESGATVREIADVLGAATAFYKSELKGSDTAIEYLKGRGLTGEIAARFGLGYAPPRWQGLAAAFPDYRAKVLLDAGLVIEGEDGKRYDRFRDRIMFPIVSARGDVVGFGGRVLGQGEPKYLNSPETPVFEKGREVYGLYQARAAIRASDRVVVVEGYMDVVALGQHGVNDAVATLGTATTPFHVQKLLKQARRVVFCFDGDNAGRRAAWRALENCVGQLVDGKEVAFAFLPEGDDPDSYVRRVGREGFEQLIDDAMPLSAFLLQQLAMGVDLNSHEGRAKLLKDAKPLVTGIAAPVLALVVRKRVAEIVGLDQTELDRLWGLKPNNFGSEKVRLGRTRVPLVANETLYRKLLACLVLNPRSHELVKGGDLLDSTSENCKRISELLEFLGSSTNVQHSAGVFEFFRQSGNEDLHRSIRGELELLSDWTDSELNQEVNDLLRKIAAERELDEAASHLSKGSPRDIDQGTRESAHRALRAGKVALPGQGDKGVLLTK
jgi:DNA primase